MGWLTSWSKQAICTLFKKWKPKLQSNAHCVRVQDQITYLSFFLASMESNYIVWCIVLYLFLKHTSAISWRNQTTSFNRYFAFPLKLNGLANSIVICVKWKSNIMPLGGCHYLIPLFSLWMLLRPWGQGDHYQPGPISLILSIQERPCNLIY